MIGTDLNLDLPSLGDSFTNVVAKTVICLSAIEDSLADRATPAALLINDELNLQGNPLTNVSSLVLAAGNLTNLPGSFFYYGGEFYAVDSTGTVQLTVNGAINAAPGSISGLVAPAAVTWDTGSQEFRFTANNTPTYADLVCDDVVLKGSAGSVRLDVDPAITANRSVVFKSLPASGVSFLVYKASSSTVEDSAANTDAKTIAGDVTFTADIKHSSIRSMRFSLSPAANTANGTLGVHDFTSTPGTWGWTGVGLPLKAGDQITKIGVYVATAVSGNINVRLYRTTDALVNDIIHTYTFNPGTTAGLYSQTVTVPVTLAADAFQFLEVSGSATGVVIRSAYIEYKRP